MFTQACKKVTVLLIVVLVAMTSCTRMKRGNGPKKFPLTPSQIIEIVDKHNQLRASVSSSNMRFMTWDVELASIAEDYGTKCQFSHNTEGEHSKFKNNVGENIYVARSPVETFESSRAIQMWFDEKKDFTYSTRTCAEGKKCGHYTQVTWASTYKIGCSLTMCDYVSDFNQPESHLFICNYSPAGNVYTLGPLETRTMLKPFIKGKACTKCDTPTDTCTDGLCANEIRDSSTIAGSPFGIPSDPGDNLEKESSCGGLITAVVLLSLVLTGTVIFIIYREKNKFSSKMKGWKQGTEIDHTKFSNQNTPVPSCPGTPRQSIVNMNLHGNAKLCDVNGRLPVPSSERPTKSVKPSAPAKPARPKSRELHRVIERSSKSAPNSPMRPLRPPQPPSHLS